MLDFLNLRHVTIDDVPYVSTLDFATHLAGSALRIESDVATRESDGHPVSAEERAYVEGAMSTVAMIVRILIADQQLDYVLDEILKSS